MQGCRRNFRRTKQRCSCRATCVFEESVQRMEPDTKHQHPETLQLQCVVNVCFYQQLLEQDMITTTKGTIGFLCGRDMRTATSLVGRQPMTSTRIAVAPRSNDAPARVPLESENRVPEPHAENTCAPQVDPTMFALERPSSCAGHENQTVLKVETSAHVCSPMTPPCFNSLFIKGQREKTIIRLSCCVECGTEARISFATLPISRYVGHPAVERKGGRMEPHMKNHTPKHFDCM